MVRAPATVRASQGGDYLLNLMAASDVVESVAAAGSSTSACVASPSPSSYGHNTTRGTRQERATELPCGPAEVWDPLDRIYR